VLLAVAPDTAPDAMVAWAVGDPSG
jgi:hypothetical protein